MARSTPVLLYFKESVTYYIILIDYRHFVSASRHKISATVRLLVRVRKRVSLSRIFHLVFRLYHVILILMGRKLCRKLFI